MPVEWPAALLPEAALLGFATAVASGVVGGAMARSLGDDPGPALPRPQRLALVGSAAVLVAAIAYTLPVTEGDPVRAQVTTTEVRPSPDREIEATVTLDPPDAAENAEWFNVTAWQGGGSRLVGMRRVGRGIYRTEGPVPVDGTWKSILRLHRGSSIAGMPLFMPEDSAIPAAEVPAAPQFERAFALDKENLQREQKDGVAGGLTLAAYLIVLAIATAMVAALSIALARLGGASARRTRPRTDTPVATA
jgi:hypothetical protein